MLLTISKTHCQGEINPAKSTSLSAEDQAPLRSLCTYRNVIHPDLSIIKGTVQLLTILPLIRIFYVVIE